MNNHNVVVIDLGMSNINSVCNMVKKVGGKFIITSRQDTIRNATKIILPGVGSFDQGMKSLKSKRLIPVLNEMVLIKKTPILGICLGMQLMTLKSLEGNSKGLGWFNAKCKKFDSNLIKVPHIGWNYVENLKEGSILGSKGEKRRFYFVHSYFISCKEKSEMLSKTFYGNLFVSGIQRDNIIGVQFHPEKSHSYGMTLMKNFINF